MQRRVVHCYYVSGEDRMTLVIHFDHRMYVPPANTRMTTGHDVQVKYNKDNDTLLVDDLFSDPKRISFKQLDAKMAEVWTLRKDV